jgi:radical SAM superfamily enzyme YgiQ (UPF0313 family)
MIHAMHNIPEIALATLNAKFIHASMGLRCLLANLDRHGKPGLRARAALREYVIEQRAIDIVADLLGTSPAEQPRVIGFGVYIWNVTETTQVLRLLKALAPQIKIAVGGPEVSYETDQQEICRLADHVITGWGDVSFAQLCTTLLDGTPTQRAVLPKIIAGIQPPLEDLALPYAEYSDADLAHRLLYVEASRGCPFKCEFCLSSLDKTAWAFELDRFLAEMQTLVQRGAKHFKFVDRTFNLKIDTSARILEFFLDHLARGEELFVHFEVVPDVLPDRLKVLISRFPPGCLQFEVGVQTFTSEVQQRISRRQDEAKTLANIGWLVNDSPAHLHTDLIFGLPGETLDSFAASFDQLVRLKPHEVQFGMLKRLRGTPILRHTEEWGMVYDPAPPYVVLQTSTIPFATMQRIARMARYWEIVANSGKHAVCKPLLLGLELPGASPFQRFLGFSDWLWTNTGKTHAFAAEKLLDLLFDYLRLELGDEAARVAVASDWQRGAHRKLPQCLIGFVDERAVAKTALQAKHAAKRQARNLPQAA